jgi:hypothetical protein
MADGFIRGRFTDGPGGRRARKLAFLTVLAVLAMLVAGIWYQLSEPTTPSQGDATAAPRTDGAPAAPPATP